MTPIGLMPRFAGDPQRIKVHLKMGRIPLPFDEEVIV